MPCFGLTSFLQLKGEKEEYVKKGVNALLRAYFISTWILDFEYSSRKKCQCPASGLLHFYVLKVMESQK